MVLNSSLLKTSFRPSIFSQTPPYAKPINSLSLEATNQYLLLKRCNPSLDRQQPILGHSMATTSNRSDNDDFLPVHSCVDLGLKFSVVTTANSSLYVVTYLSFFLEYFL
ncbi:hypothetical protein I3843_06G072800 [Carya illinoinensis]|uniref:Uncharacterized protein n=1 Tax=Carya illinoinensis TaxID=32201 RepID=A0A922EVK2_CARIL|nr:hypothetical protein I3760_06G078900 [Carya illinoinensis]KAG6708392.1 hypothetical protein I3842_06G078900 [Carya illinoinensis]KAG7974935.1 hypothetical protein I3843_06G072800 [Carya illinoinensis]